MMDTKKEVFIPAFALEKSHILPMSENEEVSSNAYKIDSLDSSLSDFKGLSIGKNVTITNNSSPNSNFYAHKTNTRLLSTSDLMDNLEARSLNNIQRMSLNNIQNTRLRALSRQSISGEDYKSSKMTVSTDFPWESDSNFAYKSSYNWVVKRSSSLRYFNTDIGLDKENGDIEEEVTAL